MTYSDPKVTYIDPTHLLLHLQPHLVHTGLNHGDLEKYGWKVGGGGGGDGGNQI